MEAFWSVCLFVFLESVNQKIRLNNFGGQGDL